MLADALQHVDEVRVRVDALEPAGAHFSPAAHWESFEPVWQPAGSGA